MKVIEEGNKDWRKSWVGTDFECLYCRSLIQLEEGDDEFVEFVIGYPDKSLMTEDDPIVEGGDIKLTTPSWRFTCPVCSEKTVFSISDHLSYHISNRRCLACGSRNIHLMHIVTAEDISEEAVEELRDHVDAAMHNAEYALVTNYYIDWKTILTCRDCAGFEIETSSIGER